jgi:hypothetical protein
MSGPSETPPEISTAGSVVLDIGGDVGAAVVYTPEALLGEEIEVRPAGEQWTGRHVAVHQRLVQTGPVYAAVFPHLVEGAWEVRIRGRDSSPVVPFSVVGGQVTSATFPDAS